MRVNITDRQGGERAYFVSCFYDLYLQLTDELKIDALCGGNCSCATCHVYLEDHDAGSIKPPGADEVDVLTGLRTYAAGSRLLCQLEAEKEVREISLKIAPSE